MGEGSSSRSERNGKGGSMSQIFFYAVALFIFCAVIAIEFFGVC